MRAIRVTTALLLIAAAGAILLTIGLYIDDTLTDHARRRTRDILRAEAQLAVGMREAATEDPFALTHRVATTTRRRATLFSPDGELLADAIPSIAQPAARPSSSELWRSISTNRDRPGLLHAGARLPDGSILLLTASPAPAARARASITRFLIITFLVLAVLATILAARGWTSVDQALERIDAVAERLCAGDLTARVPEVRQGALSGLTSRLNAAIERTGQMLTTSREQGRYYAAILDQMTDAVVAVDERAHVQFVNRPFARLFDVEPQDTVGRPVENVVLNYEISALINRALEQGAEQRDRLSLTHPDEYLLEGVSTPLTDETGEVIGAVGLLHDITQLREADRVRQDFVANASHELRTPAAGIKALAEALQAGAINDAERGPKFLQQIVASADRLTEILDDMLTLTRMERGGRLLEPRMIDAATALEDAAGQVRPAANQKGVGVTVECGQDDRVYADPGALQTLLLNLLDNAVKYTPGGGGVTARGRSVPGGYEFSVADTGVGIPEEHHQRIFERFYRVDRARDRATGSTGLGLSIVRHIAQSHGGRVRVSSEESRGSVFTAFFPERSG